MALVSNCQNLGPKFTVSSLNTSLLRLPNLSRAEQNSMVTSCVDEPLVRFARVWAGPPYFERSGVSRELDQFFDDDVEKPLLNFVMGCGQWEHKLSNMSHKKHQSFLTKLASMLRSPQFQHIIRWKSFNSFQVLDTRQLENQVLTRYFRHSKYSSFVRQLNMYNFHKIRSQPFITFTHDYFNQGKMTFEEDCFERKKYTQKVENNRKAFQETRFSDRKSVKIEHEEVLEIQPPTRKKRSLPPSLCSGEVLPQIAIKQKQQKQVSIDGQIQNPQDLEALAVLRNVSLIQLESEIFSAIRRQTPTQQELISIRYIDWNNEGFHLNN